MSAFFLFHPYMIWFAIAGGFARICGSGGNDTHVVRSNYGTTAIRGEAADGDDTIRNFQQNAEVIRFTGGNIRYSDLNISDSSAGAIIDYGSGDTILVENTLAIDMTEGDFQFQ
ncbi:hypothetical protein [Aliiroseovarius sp. 2305UL8-7]|uniref:hypothetical protein n=1 Tax=Aliiroseovarius conchicola TaxID=3121637 RepID=UPI003526D3BB